MTERALLPLLNMTRTKKLIFLAIFTIFVIVAIIFILRAPRRGSGATSTNTPSGGLPTATINPPPLVVPPPRPLTPEERIIEDDKAVGRRVSVVFAERFGSYSNQAGFANSADLYPIMTSPMRAWADNFRAEAIKKQSTAGYAGVTTRALTSAVDEYLGSEGRMRVVVGTQREETTNDGTKKVYTQELTVHLIKDAGVWKVNSIEWGEAR